MSKCKIHRNAGNVCAESGFSLLFIIGAILAISTLAAGMLSLSTSSVYTELNTLSIAQARLVALSGFNYVLQFKEDYDELEGSTFTLDNDSQFTIGDNMRQRQDSDGILWMDVEIIGTVHKGTPSEANYVLDRSFQPEDQGAITFADNWEDFKEITADNGKNPITKNSDKTFTIGNNENYAFGAFYYMGTKSLNWGANECVLGECQFKYGFRLFFVSHYDTSAADGITFAWYNAQNDGTGTDASVHGKDCTDYEAYSDEDDYTACQDSMADSTNTIYASIYEACEADSSDCGLYASVGGDSNAGEMIGYAGDGRYWKSTSNRTLSGWLDPEQNGIQAPKMGIEFDNFYNSSSNICGSIGNIPSTGSRNDPYYSGYPSHLAYVYWGVDESSSSTPYECALYSGSTTTGGHGRGGGGGTTTYTYYTVSSASYGLSAGTSNIEGANTYDDNRHGYGFNTKYVNRSSNASVGYNWANSSFAFRAEVERHYRYTNDDGTYDYTITSWFRKCDSSDSACGKYWDDDYYDADDDTDDLYFSDTSRFLCWDSSDSKCDSSNLNTPTLQQTVGLTEEQNEQFDTMMFGFTESTGGSTQDATYSQFIMQFIKENDYNYVVTDSSEADYHIKIASRRRMHNRKID